MVVCELCGKELHGDVHKVNVEGSILTSCFNCVKYGTEVQFARKTPTPALSDFEKAEQRQTYTPPPRKVRMPYSQAIEEVTIVDDYPKLIRTAWQKSGMKLKEFAQMLNEKESVVSKLMSGNMTPDDKLVKKIERKLKVKLVEEPGEDY